MRKNKTIQKCTYTFLYIFYFDKKKFAQIINLPRTASFCQQQSVTVMLDACNLHIFRQLEFNYHSLLCFMEMTPVLIVKTSQLYKVCSCMRQLINVTQEYMNDVCNPVVCGIREPRGTHTLYSNLVNIRTNCFFTWRNIFEPSTLAYIERHCQLKQVKVLNSTLRPGSYDERVNFTTCVTNDMQQYLLLAARLRPN